MRFMILCLIMVAGCSNSPSSEIATTDDLPFLKAYLVEQLDLWQNNRRILMGEFDLSGRYDKFDKLLSYEIISEKAPTDPNEIFWATTGSFVVCLETERHGEVSKRKFELRVFWLEEGRIFTLTKGTGTKIQ